jgi:hypothetical protein
MKHTLASDVLPSSESRHPAVLSCNDSLDKVTAISRGLRHRVLRTRMNVLMRSHFGDDAVRVNLNPSRIRPDRKK